MQDGKVFFAEKKRMEMRAPGSVFIQNQIRADKLDCFIFDFFWMPMQEGWQRGRAQCGERSKIFATLLFMKTSEIN